jgi:hypothetical protein
VTNPILDKSNKKEVLAPCEYACAVRNNTTHRGGQHSLMPIVLLSVVYLKLFMTRKKAAKQHAFFFSINIKTGLLLII